MSQYIMREVIREKSRNTDEDPRILTPKRDTDENLSRGRMTKEVKKNSDKENVNKMNLISTFRYLPLNPNSLDIINKV